MPQQRIPGLYPRQKARSRPEMAEPRRELAESPLQMVKFVRAFQGLPSACFLVDVSEPAGFMTNLPSVVVFQTAAGATTTTADNITCYAGNTVSRIGSDFTPKAGDAEQ